MIIIIMYVWKIAKLLPDCTAQQLRKLPALLSTSLYIQEVWYFRTNISHSCARIDTTACVTYWLLCYNAETIPWRVEIYVVKPQGGHRAAMENMCAKFPSTRRWSAWNSKFWVKLLFSMKMRYCTEAATVNSRSSCKYLKVQPIPKRKHDTSPL
jgi:hypothetical protein